MRCSVAQAVVPLPLVVEVLDSKQVVVKVEQRSVVQVAGKIVLLVVGIVWGCRKLEEPS